MMLCDDETCGVMWCDVVWFDEIQFDLRVMRCGLIGVVSVMRCGVITPYVC